MRKVTNYVSYVYWPQADMIELFISCQEIWTYQGKYMDIGVRLSFNS